MAKIGRPPVKNPRKNIVGVALTDEQIKRLDKARKRAKESRSGFLASAGDARATSILEDTPERRVER